MRVDIREYAALARASVARLGRKNLRSEHEVISDFYQFRDPKYVGDAFAQAGVAATADKVSNDLKVDGVDTYSIEYIGTLGSSTLALEAMLDPESSQWSVVWTADTLGTIGRHIGNYRRVRLHFTYVDGAITKVNLLAVKG